MRILGCALIGIFIGVGTAALHIGWEISAILSAMASGVFLIIVEILERKS